MYRVSTALHRSSEFQPSDLRPVPGPNPNKVVQAFNTWAFKREQPSDQALLSQIVSDSIARNEPIPFVLYWGKGPRSRIAAPDLQCLDYLAALQERVHAAYGMGAVINLVFTDTHATLNGHGLESIHDYFCDLRHAAHMRGFHCSWLGELLRAAKLFTTEEPDEHISEAMLDLLAKCAERWYQGGASPREGALQYYRMNLLEKRAIEMAFPRSIFVTFNHSKFRAIFPDTLPIFYMYSLKRGFGVKPWFLDEDCTPFLKADGTTDNAA